jgi:hypothetical protein
LVRIAGIKIANSNVTQTHTWVFQLMEYVTSMQSTRKLKFIANMKSFPKKCLQSTCMLTVEKFLKEIYINVNNQECRCITWIELYVLYRICGNDKPLEAKTCTIGDRAKQLISLDLQFRHFKNLVRCICSCALNGGDDEKRFQPAEIKVDNLINVGIEGKLPAVGFNVSINEHTQKQMTKALMLLGRNMSNQRLEQFFEDDNPTYHKAGPICFKGKAGWDTRLPNFNGSLDQLNPEYNQDVVMNCSDNSRIMYIAQCPTCNKQSSCQNYKFQYHDLGKKIKCVECHKFSCISEWKCNCGVLWHTCKVHYCTIKVKPKPKVKLTSDSLNMRGLAAKRLLENATHDQILDDDLRIQAKRDKRNWIKGEKIISDDRPTEIRLTNSMLPKSLREKFPNLELR